MGEPISVEVRLFARLRELCGTTEGLSVQLPAGSDAAGCFAEICRVFPALDGHRDGLVVAINEDYAAWETALADGDVVTFIPPVSGGSNGSDPRFAVVEEAIAAAALRPLVESPAFGALCSFEGIVRDHSDDFETAYLEYEAYAPMAEGVFARIADTAARRWPGTRLAIHHRVGHLEIGEVSVAIVAAAEHRREAFEACRFAIEQLKASAPIWKKEFGPDGSHWVEGPRARAVDGEIAGDDGEAHHGEPATAATEATPANPARDSNSAPE